MAFQKRRKQTHLYRGANPDPTNEEIAAGVHTGRVPHARPDPTAEEKAAQPPGQTAQKKSRVGRSRRKAK